MKNKILLVIIFTMIVITTAISGSYAYFKVNTEDNNANVNITASAPTCITLQLDNLVSLNITDKYAVPVADSKALSGTVYRSSFSIVNNCDTSQTFDILVVPTDASTMPMNALKYAFISQAMPTPSSGTIFNSPISLSSDIIKEMTQKGYTVSQGFVVGNGTLSASDTGNYYLYIWIDENEGGLANNITMDKVFNGLLTISTNASAGTAASYATITDLASSDSRVTATLTKGTFDLAYYGLSDEEGNAPEYWTPVTAAGGSVSTPKICEDGNYYLFAKDVNGNVTKSSSTVSVTAIVNTLADKLTCKYGTMKIAANGTPDFSAVASTNEGMFATTDNDGDAFYYRGAVNDNWAKFGQENGNDIWWRIIRTNGDGSVRLLYAGTTAPTEAKSVNSTTTPYPRISVSSTTTFKFNSATNNAVYAGFQYVTGNAHGYGKCTTAAATSCDVSGTTVNNSIPKQKLEAWWNTTNLGTLFSDDKVADEIYCNDRDAYTNTACTTPAAVGAATQYFGAYGRNQNKKQPSLTCANEADRFTVNASRGTGLTTGNGALLYPVGLVTADEYAMAGAKYSTDSTLVYMHAGITLWTMSAYSFGSSKTNNFYINNNSRLYFYSVSAISCSLRPVISVSADLDISGSGLYNDPYIFN